MGVNRPRRQPTRPHLYAVSDDFIPIPRDRGPGLELTEAEWEQRDPDAEPRRIFRGLAYAAAYAGLFWLIVFALAIALGDFSEEVAPDPAPAAALEQPVNP